MSFRFTIPSPSPNEAIKAETRPKQTKAWLDALPLAQTLVSSRTLSQALYHLNRTKLGGDDRFKLMELYRPAALRLLDDLAQDYRNVSLPLPESARDAVKAARELLVENAYGYKIILLEKSTSIFTGKKQLALLLHRLTSALSELLTLSYRAYMPTPAGVWHEIHQLYHYAQHFALEQLLVDTGRAQNVSNVGLVYKQALLLSLADPYRLASSELEQVLAVVQRYHSEVLILPYRPELTGGGLFLVRSDSDKPPKSLFNPGPVEAAPVDKILSAANLVQKLGEALGKLDAGASASQLSLPLHVTAESLPIVLRRLEKCWSVPPTRSFTRKPTTASAEVCVGLSNLCIVLGRPGATPNSSVDTTVPGPTAAPLLTTEWDISNQSAGGLALRRSSATGTSISVGELVGVRIGADQPWGIGAIRWVHGEENADIQFGLQMLAPSADVVMLQASDEGAIAAKLRVLTLPEMPALKRSATLLTPVGVYRESRHYQLTQRGETALARATKLVEQTKHFELFEFMIPGGPARE